MRLAVTGGREFQDKEFVYRVLCDFAEWHSITAMTAGRARGVDTFAEDWAAEYMIYFNDEFAAEWDKYGKAAGPIRNQEILDQFKPDAVIKFPGGTGTADMVDRVKRLKRAGSRIVLIEVDPETYNGGLFL